MGISAGGAFDLDAHELANALVGNEPDANAATLEMTLFGGTYEAESTLALALAGAPMRASLERSGSSRRLVVPGSFTLLPGDRLVLRGTPVGARTYLAVAGGWRTTVVLGSRSQEVPVVTGMRLDADSSWVPQRWVAGRQAFPGGDAIPVIRVVEGPDASRPERDPDGRISPIYRVLPDSNRIGIRLSGPSWPFRPQPERLSSPVLPGAVQVAGGQPLILGVACGTMGGYPHVAQVIAADRPRLAQLPPGTDIRFRWISLDEARTIDRVDQERRRSRTRRVATLARDGLKHPDD